MDFRFPAAVPAGGVANSRRVADTGNAPLKRRLYRRIVVGLFIVCSIASVFAVSQFRADATDFRTPQNAYLYGLPIGDADTNGLQEYIETLSDRQFNVRNALGQIQAFRLSEIGIVINPKDTLDAVLAARGNAWLVENGRANLRPVVHVDEVKLQAFSQAILTDALQPENARIVVQDGRAVVVPARTGRGLTAGHVLEALAITQATGNIVLVLSSSELRPAITTDQAEAVYASATQFLAADTTVQLDGVSHTVRHIDVVQFSQHPESGTIDFGFDSERLRQALAVIAKAASRPAWHEIYEVKNGQRSIVRAGTEGVTFEGVEEAVGQLLRTGVGPLERTVTLVKSTQAYQSFERSAAQIWIDVDLTRHVMTLWENGAVHREIPISGGKVDTPTPLGEFRISSKTRKMTMSGPGYATPNVEYISWFTYNYAIHSAYWHNRFGEANVSLGCVNAPTDEAKYVYEWAPVGTKVVTR